MSVAIRRANVDDAEALARIHDDSSVRSGTLQTPYPLISSWRDRCAQTDGQIMLVAVSGEAVIANLGLYPNSKTPRRAHAASLMMGVHAAWKRKGVGSALLVAALDIADNWYGLARVELTVYTDNEAGIGLYKKFGFETEATLRKYALREGAFVDAYAMARLRTRPT
jgi:putative acetyltransferase